MENCENQSIIKLRTLSKVRSIIYESENVEYKSQMLEDLYKEVVAFANTDDSVIYMGIDNQSN